MKRIGIIFGIVVVIAALFIFVNKSYYPSLPIDNLSAKEAIGKLKKSDEKIVEISTDDDFTWYLTRSQNEGDSTPYQNIQQMIGSNGWEFKDQMGAGFFFEGTPEEMLHADTLINSEMAKDKHQIKHAS